MRNRMIGGSLLLLATACFVCWGQDQAQTIENDQPPVAKAAAVGGADESGTKTKDPQAVVASKVRHGVRKPPAPHLTEAEDAASERAIRAQAAALIAEYNAKHAEAFAERFLPSAEYELDTGEVITGQPAIRAYFEESFEQFPDARAQSKESKIRLISLHMAIEEGTNSIRHSADDTESECGYVAIWTFSEGRWLLASIRDLPSEDVPDTAHEHLESLGWLVGDWVDESPDALVEISCRWSDDENFLLQDFTVKVQGSDALSGTRRIGWDPLSHRIRAWLFDSHGGFGESFWN